MHAASLENVTRAPWPVIFPGAAIFLVADGLRDALDPRLKQ
jgi:ABC-type dipeptide/oligopeptide/nickel transport system permease subunit